MALYEGHNAIVVTRHPMVAYSVLLNVFSIGTAEFFFLHLLAAHYIAENNIIMKVLLLVTN